MYRTIFIFLLSTLLVQAQDSRTILESYNKAVSKRNSVSITVIDKIKFYNSDTFTIDTLTVFMTRSKSAPYIQSLVRIQHSNGNLEAYNGFEFKMLGMADKTIFIADTTNAASALLIGRGIPQFVMKFLPNETYRFDFAPKYQFSKPEKVNIYGSECYQFTLTSPFEQPKNKESNGLNMPVPVNDSLTLAFSIADTQLRRFYRVVKMEDGTTQIEDLNFTSIHYDVVFDNNIFDLQAPEGFAVENYKDRKEKRATLEKGTAAPQFTLADDKDKEYRLSDYKGKVVLLDFWGTWCKWCVKSMPVLQKIHEKYSPKGVALIGISCSEPHGANPRKFMDDHKYTYQLLVQGDKAAIDYKVTGYPTLFVIGKDGNIAEILIGYEPTLSENLSKIIENELKK